MPALRKTDQQRRDDAWRGSLARCKAEKRMTDEELAQVMGRTTISVSRYRNGGPWTMPLGTFATLARRIGMTGEEVCRIIGIPYARKEESA